MFCISAVSFPLLLDRDVGAGVAVATSIRSVFENIVPMAIWALIITAGLIVGFPTLFIGLAVIVPVLGHATWHLYRRVVEPVGLGERISTLFIRPRGPDPQSWWPSIGQRSFWGASSRR